MKRIELRDASSWFELEPGRVTIVVLRRVSQAEGHWRQLRASGPTKAAALAELERQTDTTADRSKEHARRRQHWGPRELRSRR